MLVTCPECGEKISNEANPCPYCGKFEAGNNSVEVITERNRSRRRLDDLYRSYELEKQRWDKWAEGLGNRRYISHGLTCKRCGEQAVFKILSMDTYPGRVEMILLCINCSLYNNKDPNKVKEAVDRYGLTKKPIKWRRIIIFLVVFIFLSLLIIYFTRNELINLLNQIKK